MVKQQPENTKPSTKQIRASFGAGQSSSTEMSKAVQRVRHSYCFADLDRILREYDTSSLRQRRVHSIQCLTQDIQRMTMHITYQ